MAAVSGAKTVGAPFDNESTFVRVVYDFAEDAGAAGALDLLTATNAIVVKSFHAVVKTAATSGGSATVTVGVSGGDDDAALDATSGAVANLTANAVLGQEATVPFYVAAGGKVVQTIGTAALTAGKIEYVFEIMKP